MNLSALSDEKLYEQFQQNYDPKGFTELVKRYEPYVIRKCYYHLKNHDDIQDVAQEVFIRLLTKAHTYRSEAPFKPWLNTIIHNRCTDHINQDKHVLHQEISNKIADTLEEEIDTKTITHPTTEILQKLLERVSGEEKLILLLKYEQQWSIKAIQEALNLSESAVKQRLKRSREKLQKLLDYYTNAMEQ